MMALLMQEGQFLAFYRDSMFGYSKAYQKSFLRKLKDEGRLSTDEQCSLNDASHVFMTEKHQPDKSIISQMSQDIVYASNFEFWEFTKLYKYSVPFFFEMREGTSFQESLCNARCVPFQRDDFKPKYLLSRKIDEEPPYYFTEEDRIFIKFVLQKAYLSSEDYQLINYRYPVVIYINTQLNILEIRFDSVRFDPQFMMDSYEDLVNDCIKWVSGNLGLALYFCNCENAISIINSKEDDSVKIYKQMMELRSGGSAELTASEENDSVMPFIGELRELIEENEEAFARCTEIKELLLNYLNEKEMTASYPYIYIKRVKPVESDSYIVKITFDYYFECITVLQHQTGICRDLGMERMNDAIKYLCESGSFTKGESIECRFGRT